MPADELREAFLTSGLTDAQRAELVAVGTERPFVDGEVLFVEGEPADLLWIVLDGAIELTRRSGTDTIVLATMSTPGQWAGGLRAWGADDEMAGYRATGTGCTDGRCLVVPSDELGRLVSEWFPFGQHMIRGIWQTVRGIEATARQRESLVALGTMAAGLAHEINNPAAASLRAVESLRTATGTLFSSLSGLAGATISAEQFMALDALRREAVDADPPQGGALELADAEASIGEWLEQRGVADAWQLGSGLAAAGVGLPWCERVEQEVGSSALGPAVEWLASTLDVGALLDEIEDTTTRISGLVAAVKSYSQMDRSSLQRIDVHEGIESTLTMLGSKLHHIEVHRDFECQVDDFEAHPGELNQVWTNLIDNAIDAMDGRGTLTVTTRVDGGDIVVDITDTGRGMSADVQHRAFEPFFTTKDVGKGTGLGLDISRRIVSDRHGGEITFDSSPSGTTARVRLPVRRADVRRDEERRSSTP